MMRQEKNFKAVNKMRFGFLFSKSKPHCIYAIADSYALFSSLLDNYSKNLTYYKLLISMLFISLISDHVHRLQGIIARLRKLRVGGLYAAS